MTLSRDTVVINDGATLPPSSAPDSNQAPAYRSRASAEGFDERGRDLPNKSLCTGFIFQFTTDSPSRLFLDFTARESDSCFVAVAMLTGLRYQRPIHSRFALPTSFVEKFLWEKTPSGGRFEELLLYDCRPPGRASFALLW